jgi:hemoglobin
MWALGCSGAKPAAVAGPEPPAASSAAPASSFSLPPLPPGPSLYDRLGKWEALLGVADELIGNVLADNRISKLFEKAKKDKERAKVLRLHMAEELCVVAGGDCNYNGRTMKEAHEGMNITEVQWKAFVEDLSIALKTRGVDDAAAKELLGKLGGDLKAEVVGQGRAP